MEKNQKSSKKLVGLLVFASLIWAGAMGLAQAAPKKILVAHVQLGQKKAEPKRTEKIVAPQKAHYEVTEWDEELDIVPTRVYGFLRIGKGQIEKGPNCCVSAITEAAALIGITRTPSGPVKVKRAITVKWIPGPNNEPEPKNGVDITFHHYTSVYANNYGLSLGNWGPPVSVRADAKTTSPSGNKVQAGTIRFQFLLSLDSNEETQTKPDFGFKGEDQDTLKGLKSGWKGYMTAEVEVNSYSGFLNFSKAEATALVTWEASCKGGR